MPLHLPSAGLAIHTIPKNGGTTLHEVVWFLKTGEQFPCDRFGKPGVYHAEAARTFYADCPAVPARRMVIVRDPVDRAVSIYRRGVRMGYFKGVPFDRVLMNHVVWSRRVGDYAHHARSQFEWAGGLPISEFTHVVPFSDFGRVFDLLSEWAGVEVPRPHRQAAGAPRPEVTDLSRRLIRHIWAADYDHGFADPPGAVATA